jgi:spermidine synthase
MESTLSADATAFIVVVNAALVALALVVGGWWLATDQGWLRGPCVRETNYYCIKVIDEDHDGNQVKLLVLDHLVHSYIDLKNPTTLVYPYEKAYAEMAQYRSVQPSPMRVAMIGGGGYTFARYMATIYPQGEMNVIEIDPGVTQFAYDELGLSHNLKITTFNEDARLFFARQPTNRYDLVLGDAFNHFSVPYHLTTKEFNDEVRGWLKDDGIYVVNIIDGPYGEFVRAYYNTLRLTFRHVYLAEGSAEWRKAIRSMFLLIASDAPLDIDRLAKTDGGDGDALTARMLVGDDEIKRLLTEAPVVTLTDQFAPVDQMLASVFREEVPK